VPYSFLSSFAADVQATDELHLYPTGTTSQQLRHLEGRIVLLLIIQGARPSSCVSTVNAASMASCGTIGRAARRHRTTARAPRRLCAVKAAVLGDLARDPRASAMAAASWRAVALATATAGWLLLGGGGAWAFPAEDLVTRLPGQAPVTFRQFAGYVDVDVGRQEPLLLLRRGAAGRRRQAAHAVAQRRFVATTRASSMA
jgi:hypothetical protein